MENVKVLLHSKHILTVLPELCFESIKTFIIKITLKNNFWLQNLYATFRSLLPEKSKHFSIFGSKSKKKCTNFFHFNLFCITSYIFDLS